LKFAAIDAPDQIAPAVHLVPTVLDLLSLPSDETLPGNSLLPPMTGQPTPTTAYASSRMFRTQWSALDRQGHYIEDGAQKIFYDLPTDTVEQTPGTAPSRYEQALQKWKRNTTLQAPPGIAENFDEHEVLKLLGYVE
jgi:arylsulfatase A-like enzyme